MNEQNQNNTVEESTEIVALDLTFTPEVFDPNKEQLHAIAAEVAKIEADPEKMTKDTLELINATKNKLVKARTKIQKIGKAQREPATKYAKEVKAYEDELLAILAPEEDRMKELEKTAKEHAMREERRKTLPEFIEKLNAIGDGIAAEEAFLLSLDPNQRDQYYNERLAAKNEADREALEAEKAAKAAEEEAAAKAEEDAKRQAERDLLNARREIMLEMGFFRTGDELSLDTIDGTLTITYENLLTLTESEFANNSTTWRKLADAKKAADLAAAEKAAAAKAQEEAAQRAADEEAKRRAEEEAAKKAEEEAAAKAEQVRKEQEAHEAYQKWLSDSSYNAETDVVKQENGVYVLYRKISTYTPQIADSAPQQ